MKNGKGKQSAIFVCSGLNKHEMYRKLCKQAATNIRSAGFFLSLYGQYLHDLTHGNYAQASEEKTDQNMDFLLKRNTPTQYKNSLDMHISHKNQTILFKKHLSM